MTQCYIVYAPAFSPNNGGAIFLHNLVHVLNEMGQDAKLWPMAPVYRPGWRARLKGLIWPVPYVTNPDLDTPVARRGDLGPDTIVVYPEITLGNPLGMRHVVRWLLYKPGLRHAYEFGPDEMFFRVGEMSDLPELTGGAPDLTMWSVNRTYRNENRPDRSGVAYIVRKGDAKPRLPQTEAPDAIQIDGMSHEEINDVFNRVETFISYDEATMYSQYAAVCGCTSIVVPGLAGSREDWVKSHELARYGVAYGLEDTPHAQTTRHKVLPLLEAEEAKGRSTVERFIELTKNRFFDTIEAL